MNDKTFSAICVVGSIIGCVLLICLCGISNIQDRLGRIEISVDGVICAALEREDNQ